MNPFFISGIIGRFLGLTRTCSKCGKKQIVPARKKRFRVKCKFCGSDLLPPY